MRQDIANVVNKLSKESGSLNFEVTKAYELIFDEMKETEKCVTKMKICLVNRSEEHTSELQSQR